ncbi:WD40-repeat-containing domain protein [Linnemannia elongata]|nr:WD40-repeat-containing domain protein [Linnemannia elongata]
MEKRKQPPTTPTADDTHFKRLRSFPQEQPDTFPHHFHDGSSMSTIHSYHAGHILTPWLPLISRPQDTYRTAPPVAFTTTTVPNNPTRLQGHTAAVYTCAFSPSGRSIASAGADKSIYLWNMNGSGDHYGIIRGRHLGAILDIHWSRAENMLVTACADGTCGAFDAQTGERISTFKGHTASVTCCTSTQIGSELTVSGSSDGSVKIWDHRAPGIAENITPLLHQYPPVSSIAISNANDIVFSAGSGHEIMAWDRRTKRVVYTLPGHMGAITGIRLSPDGARLLSSSMDNTLRIWNLGPYSDPSRRLQKVLQGVVMQGMEEHWSRPAWSSDGLLVASGGTNGKLMIWNTQAGHVLQTLSDHQDCVHQVDFHPGERIVVSSSADKTLALRSL